MSFETTLTVQFFVKANEIVLFQINPEMSSQSNIIPSYEYLSTKKSLKADPNMNYLSQ